MRLGAAAAFVFLAGAYVARSALVELDVAAGERWWPAHPTVLSSTVMADVGRAAAVGQAPDRNTLDQVNKLAAVRPLSPEPFLVQGAIAVRRGDHALAEKLLLSAHQREPRSPAARYLLADLYLRTGRPLQAMSEMALLNRLLPGTSVQLAPSLAAYAHSPGSAGQLRSILASYPELESPLLAHLSRDPANVDLILSIAPERRGGRRPDWQRLLLINLVASGQYDRSYALWRKMTGAQSTRGALYNPGFEASDAPPPFNWRLVQGEGGVAEPGSGGLQVLYYGRDNVELASQALLLSPGRYRLAMSLSGNVPERGVRWRVRCLDGATELLSLPLTRSGEASGDFTVPATGCPAQMLSLLGEPQEFAGRADFRLSGLKLVRSSS